MNYDVSSRLANDYQDTMRPNILVIMADQQVCNTIGTYGNTIIRTPNLDRLAAEGALFERSYTTCPLCMPARASLLSGRYTHNTSAPVNDDDARLLSLEDDILTFGDIFKEEGYRCGYFGKWHIGREGMPQHGFTDGWFTHLRNSYENWLERTGQFVFPADMKSFERRGVVPYELAHDTIVTSKAIDFIEQHDQEEPFLCFCSMRAPHDPFIGPFDDLYNPHDIPLPENFDDDLSKKPFSQRISMGRKVALAHDIESADEFRKVIARYWGLVHLIDTNVGRLLHTLDERGLTENTLVMFAVDHGEMMGAHGLLTKGPFMYEETNRVPLIMRYPHHIPQGLRVNSLVSMVDYAPTLLDYAELHTPDCMEGRSLRSVVDQTGQPGKPVYWRDAVFTEHYESYTQRCPIWNVTTGQWKYNYYFGDIDELYNLADDPYEMYNLAQDHGYRNVLFELRDRLREWAIRTNAYAMVDVLNFAGHTVTPGIDFR